MPLVRSPRKIVQSFASIAKALPLVRPGTATFSAAAVPVLAAPGSAEQRAAPGILRRSLKASSIEGMFAEVVTACAGGAVLTGWALYLGLSPFLVGILAALPYIAQVVQLPAAWCTSRFGARRTAIVAVTISRQILLPLAVLPLLPLSLPGKQLLLVSVAAISAFLGVLANNGWVAWMGELVPLPIRGRYFGRRTSLCTLGGTVASLLAALWLDAGKRGQFTGNALSLLALLACLAGAVTTWLMSRQHDPSPPRSQTPFPLRSILLPLSNPAARRVLTYQLAWNAAVGCAASFFTFYMLKNLKMGFTLMAIQAAAVAFVRILAAPLWGKAIDRVGARPVLIACSFGISIIPALWVFTTEHVLWPIAVEAVFSGILWGGHNLAAFALPLSVAPREGRPFYLAAFATAGGVAFSLATVVGGLLAQNLPKDLVVGGIPLVNLHVIFLLSSAGRFSAAWLALRILEPNARPVGELFRMISSGAKALPSSALQKPALLFRR